MSTLALRGLAAALTLGLLQYGADSNASAQPFELPVVRTETSLPFGGTAETLSRVCRVTAYCDRGLTAAGVSSGIGQCAAPADIPFGSRIYIPELDREFIVTDRTARRFRHNTVDLFIPDREECLEFGRQYLECEIHIPSEPPRYASPVLASLIQKHAAQ